MADIFDEVSEDMRRNQMMGLWKKFGPGFIAALVLLVVAVGGYEFWKYRVETRSTEDSEAFGKAMTLTESGKQDEALKIFAEIQKSGGTGYSFLAGLQEADILFTRGDRAGAIKTFERLAADGGTEKVLRQYAELQALSLLMDDPKAGDLKGRLDVLAAPGAPWAPMAEELIALLEIRDGDVKSARERLERLAANEEAGQSLQARAAELASTLPSAEPAKPATSAPAAAPAAAPVQPQ